MMMTMKLIVLTMSRFFCSASWISDSHQLESLPMTFASLKYYCKKKKKSSGLLISLIYKSVCSKLFFEALQACLQFFLRTYVTGVCQEETLGRLHHGVNEPQNLIKAYAFLLYMRNVGTEWESNYLKVI